MKNRRQIWLTAGAGLLLLAAVLLIGGGGNVSRAERNEWRTAAVRAVVTARATGRSGPGADYEPEAFFPEPGETLTALSAAYDEKIRTWWIQTEYTADGEMRRAYTEAGNLDVSPETLPTEAVQRDRAVVNRSVYVYRGPGYGYNMHRDQIRSGTEGRVWQTENGYAQLDFADRQSGGRRRVWVPENALETPDD